MCRLGFTLAVWLLAATAAHAKLELQNVQPAYGPLWPERPSDTFFTRDVLCYRFLVAGLQPDEGGQAGLDVTLKLTDAAGGLVLYQPMPRATPWVGVPGSRCLAYAAAQLDRQVPPGRYTLGVTVKDTQSGEEATFSRAVTVQAPAFGVGACQLHSDPDRKVPAGSTVQAGQTLFYLVSAVGYDRSQGRFDVLARVRLLDAEGHEMVGHPPDLPMTRDNLDGVPEGMSLNYTNAVTLSIPGRYTLRVTFTDRIANQTASLDVPLHVREP